MTLLASGNIDDEKASGDIWQCSGGRVSVNERDPVSLGRPGRMSMILARRGDLRGLASLSVYDPDRAKQRERDPLAIGRPGGVVGPPGDRVARRGSRRQSIANSYENKQAERQDNCGCSRTHVESIHLLKLIARSLV